MICAINAVKSEKEIVKIKENVSYQEVTRILWKNNGVNFAYTPL
jgi:hypothetical protein